MKKDTKRTYIVVALVLGIQSGCAPSPQAVETAIAETATTRNIIATQTQMAIPTPTATILPTATSMPTVTPVVMLDGDPRDYLPDLRDMPDGYSDASAFTDMYEMPPFGDNEASIGYGILPREIAFFVLSLSKSEIQAEESYKKLIVGADPLISGSRQITRKISGYDEYKAVISGDSLSYDAFFFSRYRNATGLIAFHGGRYSQDFVTQRIVEFTRLLASKFTL